MIKRKLKEVVDSIEYDIVQYKKEIQLITKASHNYQDIYDEAQASQSLSHFEGRIDEARHIKKKLVMLKQSLYPYNFYNKGEKQND